MRRCPYCAEKTITLYEQLGGMLNRVWYDRVLTHVFCPYCSRYSRKIMGVLGNAGQVVLLLLIPVLLLLAVLDMGERYDVPPWIYGALIGLFVVLIPIHYFFVHFDKDTKAEREADARLIFAVSGKHAFVKKWNIYLVRFPKRGTNEHSPTLYAMVCGKEGKKSERTYTLRVIRADNMELPDVGEAAWLVTDAQKVVEGTVTAATPKKKL